MTFIQSRQSIYSGIPRSRSALGARGLLDDWAGTLMGRGVDMGVAYDRAMTFFSLSPSIYTTPCRPEFYRGIAMWRMR